MHAFLYCLTCLPYQYNTYQLKKKKHSAKRIYQHFGVAIFGGLFRQIFLSDQTEYPLSLSVGTIRLWTGSVSYLAIKAV